MLGFAVNLSVSQSRKVTIVFVLLIPADLNPQLHSTRSVVSKMNHHAKPGGVNWIEHGFAKSIQRLLMHVVNFDLTLDQ